MFEKLKITWIWVLVTNFQIITWFFVLVTIYPNKTKIRLDLPIQKT